VVVALLIASPIAWYAMNKWLEDFAYRIETGVVDICHSRLAGHSDSAADS
jgi:hypothetical protein